MPSPNMDLVEQMMGGSHSEHAEMKKQLYAMLQAQCSQGDPAACQQFAQMMQQDEAMAMQQDQRRQQMMREEQMRSMPQGG